MGFPKSQNTFLQDCDIEFWGYGFKHSTSKKLQKISNKSPAHQGREATRGTPCFSGMDAMPGALIRYIWLDRSYQLNNGWRCRRTYLQDSHLAFSLAAPEGFSSFFGLPRLSPVPGSLPAPHGHTRFHHSFCSQIMPQKFSFDNGEISIIFSALSADNLFHNAIEQWQWLHRMVTPLVGRQKDASGLQPFLRGHWREE